MTWQWIFVIQKLARCFLASLDGNLLIIKPQIDMRRRSEKYASYQPHR
jgi:hypothetical protein